MTKTELEEKIKNGESVWINGLEHKLDKYYFVAEYNNEPTLYLMTCGYEEDDWDNYPVETITNIYKTKAKANHYLNHANISRTTYLPFLTWEEFKKKKIFRFVSASGTDCFMQLIENKQLLFYYGRGKVESATEENFYKLYDDCVKCFMGEV